MAGNGELASAASAFLAVLLWLGSTTAVEAMGARHAAASHRHPRHFHLNHRHRQLRSINNNPISAPSPAPSYGGPVYPPAYNAPPPYYPAWAPHYPPSYAPPYYSTPPPYPPAYAPTYHQPPPPPPPPPPSPPAPSPPPPPSPQPPSPLSVLCAAPTSCPDTATLAAAGIPNAACGNCSVSGQCFVESRQDQFLGAGATSSFLSVASCAHAKTDGSVTDPVLSFLTFPRYPTLPVAGARYPYLHLYLAAADTAPGDSAAVACYTDASLTVVDKYLVLQRIPTTADNYRCPSCKWFWSFEVRTPAAPSC